MSVFLRLPALAIALAACTSGVQAPDATAALGPVPNATPTPTPARAPQRSGRFVLTGQMIQGGLVQGTAPFGTSLLSFNGVSIPFARDRRFVIAFDRDAPATATLVATLEDGGEVRQSLTVAPRAWDIQRLDSLPRIPGARPEFDRVRPGELAQIVAARAQQTDAEGWRQPFLWPVTGRISTYFGSQRIYAGEPGAYHGGIDIARPTGTPILAPADGVVILAAATPFTLEGRLLMIDHGMGLNSAFMHLARIDVRVGQAVRRGQPIGAIGATGRATGPHLHWGMKWREARIDPLLVAGPMPVAD